MFEIVKYNPSMLDIGNQIQVKANISITYSHYSLSFWPLIDHHFPEDRHILFSSNLVLEIWGV